MALLLASLSAGVAPVLFAQAPAEPAPIDFNRDIRPILSDNCFRCHGPDEGARKAGVRLDVRDEALKPGKSGATPISPAAPGKSELLARVASADPDHRMPPPAAGKALSQQQVAKLRRWISEGAPYAIHWAYVKPVRPKVPAVKDPNLARNPIDNFVLARLENENLSPSPEAGKFTLARRVALDLTGLPLSIEEVDAFVSDPSPDAYEALVDRLLAKSSFGEHWARLWLDLARYADSAGYADDPPRTIWLYRDYVIRAFNDNRPFDQFTLEQIAGDLLPEASEEDKVATAFHRNTMTNSEGGTNDEEFRNAAVVDRVNTTMAVWMGTSMACAQCHTHKYDPISQNEYFQVFAIFNNTEDADKPDESPLLTILRTNATSEQTITNTVPVMRELAGDKRRKTRVHIRGNYQSLGDEVTEGVPAVFPQIQPPVGRLKLAQWLVGSDNPLTARVVANRFWEQMFGLGLARTSEDFGSQGDFASHPELLDWLATNLLENKWNVKAFLKLLVTSATYRQSSRISRELLERDPENILLARGPRVRMPAEVVRDQALFVSGLLSGKMFGPSVRPPRPPLGLSAAFGSSLDWKTSEGEDRYRRGLYIELRRTAAYPSLTTFDAPSREVCALRRPRSNTPLQAMVTLNDPVFVEAAQALARRALLKEGTCSEKLEYAFRLCLSRPPTEKESERLVRLYRSAEAEYGKRPEQAKEYATNPRGPLPEHVDAVQAAAMTSVANVLLNLDEMILKP